MHTYAHTCHFVLSLYVPVSTEGVNRDSCTATSAVDVESSINAAVGFSAAHSKQMYQPYQVPSIARKPGPSYSKKMPSRLDYNPRSTGKYMPRIKHLSLVDTGDIRSGMPVLYGIALPCNTSL